ncbi:hypothetical protein B0T14DRAFT_297667 [Immersiella caudata]|uniref:Uncharacterized protein n=1 Tax=Immersiella caudata TaxID=314043 RepID=A0AA39WEW9_9PEZI|nr:hypothetical protein B0T14DRAFT_297667 [Immersiella caudata]
MPSQRRVALEHLDFRICPGPLGARTLTLGSKMGAAYIGGPPSEQESRPAVTSSELQLHLPRARSASCVRQRTTPSTPKVQTSPSTQTAAPVARWNGLILDALKRRPRASITHQAPRNVILPLRSQHQHLGSCPPSVTSARSTGSGASFPSTAARVLRQPWPTKKIN